LQQFVYSPPQHAAVLCYVAPMETQLSYYVLKIKENLSLRQRSNPHYSLRAYARDLGLHSSTLSQVIKGKRPLPVKDSQQVAAKLNLGPKEKTLFLESLYRTKTSIDEIDISKNDERFIIDESYYSVIAEWEHFAVETLFEIKDFVPSISEISKRLGITENRADIVLNNLKVCGLIIQDENGNLLKAHSKIRTTEDVTSLALKESHLETLEMGKNKLEEVEVEFRDFSSMTIAMNLDRMPEAKSIIREFRQKMMALLRDGDKTDVCQLAIQLYPLTINQKSTKQELKQ
jgi:uncharacterized protein (TIGR02147 family)